MLPAVVSVELEDLEIGCEDVFESETEVPLVQSLTFENTNSTGTMKGDDENKNSSKNKMCGSENVNRKLGNSVYTSLCNNCLNDNVSYCNGKLNETENCDDQMRSDDVKTSDVRNNNTTDNSMVWKENSASLTCAKQSDKTKTNTSEERKYVICEKEPQMISVNRSYARGNSTFSVAKRCPSPFPTSRKLVIDSDLFHSHLSGYDVTTLQNISNERILSRMKRKTQWCAGLWERVTSLVNVTNLEDHVWEVFLLLCGTTFLALCFDIKPLTYMFTIMLAMMMKLILSYV